MRIGLFGAGAMGSALGAGWAAAGNDVVTCLRGRSERSVALATAAGLGVLQTPDEVTACDVVVSVVPPGSAVRVAHAIAESAARAGTRPLVVDLNAIAPTTLEQVAQELGALELVDGSISGGPPTAQHPTRVYLSGPAADRVPPNPWTDLVRLDGGLGAASALKMCTASMYKGTEALIIQAMLTAAQHGVLSEFLADEARQWPEDVPRWHLDIALAATKSGRYVDEMREIARTQAAAGLPGELFEGVAVAYERVARTPLGQRAPESVDDSLQIADVLADLTAPSTEADPPR